MGLVSMSEADKGVRLEEVFSEAWKGRENDDCIWWQGEWWKLGRLLALIDDCEGKLERAGFSKGDRLAVFLPNSPMVTALSIACWRRKGAIVPLNARAGAFNLRDTIDVLDLHSVVMTQEAHQKLIDAGKSIDTPIVPALLDAPLPEWKGRKGTPDDGRTCVIFSTSGTSGNPKAVVCRHENLYGNIESVEPHVPGLLDSDSIFLNVLPNFHTLGFNTAGMLPLLKGLRQVILPNFVPVEHTINAIKESKLNVIIAVPTVMAFLLGMLEKKNEFIPGIKCIITGGDRLNVNMDARSVKYLGRGIMEGYGLTECCPVVAVQHSEKTRRLGTVGVPYSSYEISIRDSDGNELGLHDEGVLWLKGPSVVSGYFRDEKNTKARFKDGWFNTGDVVRIDADGYMSIVDRATDIMIVSGFNVYPQEVEDVLCKHPAVHSAVAVGEKNSMTGELVKAFIILNEGCHATDRELMSYCKERLAHYKVPRKIAFVTEYPLSPSGKVLRRELRTRKITKHRD
jgi:long-chain acyl-CoA synthetase